MEIKFFIRLGTVSNQKNIARKVKKITHTILISAQPAIQVQR